MAMPGQRPKDAKWCSRCPTKPFGAVDVVNKKCECGLGAPSLGVPGEATARWCARCPGKPPSGAVNVVSRKCECGRSQPSFGMKGDRLRDARWCKLCPCRRKQPPSPGVHAGSSG
mmetsp:Transcript_19753/g.62841  ORF Transcript_19753/g.62841 Transcript_19753/m.62841 type:complete len:115 (+) Transcript_19753:413-757(+)